MMDIFWEVVNLLVLPLHKRRERKAQEASADENEAKDKYNPLRTDIRETKGMASHILVLQPQFVQLYKLCFRGCLTIKYDVWEEK